MPDQREIESRFWKALKKDMTVMLGLPGVEDSAGQPMTAQLDGEGPGPIWFFTAKDVELAQALGAGKPALLTFADKGHDLFATLQGRLVPDNDREMVGRLWNRFVAAWYEEGKDDPKLALLRFDTERAEIWEDEWSLVAGIKLLMGIDPKKDYQDKAAEVRL